MQAEERGIEHFNGEENRVMDGRHSNGYKETDATGVHTSRMGYVW